MPRGRQRPGSGTTEQDTRARKEIDALRAEVQRLRAEGDAAHRREQWLRENAAALARLSRSVTLEERGLGEAIAEILRVDARQLDVARVGVWLFDPARRRLECLSLFDRSKGEPSSGQSLTADRYPAYFAAVERERAIDASHAAVDERTRELRESYLEPHGITSMLDAPIRVFGRCAGVICHEQIGPPREWTVEEQGFAATMADFVALALERAEHDDAEGAVRATETRYRELLERARVLAAVLDLEGRFVFVNDHYLSVVGRRREELIGQECFPLVLAPEDQGPIRERFFDRTRNDAVSPSFECDLVTPAGEKRRVFWTSTALRDARGGVVGTASIGVDLTEHRRMQVELEQARKHESLGRLASGVAHDFNNLLTVILCSADLAREAVGTRSKALAHLASVRKAAVRAAELTANLLAFARRRVVSPQVFELDPLVRETVELVRPMLGETIELRAETEAEGATVLADPSQIQQVLVNLAVNARDAMPDGGRMWITSGVEELAGRHGHGQLAPGRYALVAVRDEGTGIAPVVLRRIFEPFFTTKGEGVGTGLGLASAYGIVQQAGGHIEVSTTVGRGSTFTVYLPLAAAVAAAGGSVGTSPRRRRAEKVLLVENQEMVRNSAAAALRVHGHEVLVASDAGEALELATANADTLQAAVVDVVLPDRNGRELAVALQEVCPLLKVLLISGDVGADWNDAALGPGVDFLAKPFAPDELAARVRALIAR